MRATGIIRRIDDLGRVVIPREIRKQFGVEEWDPLEFFVNDNEIILRRYDTSIGLKELVKKLDNKFSDAKNYIKTETADKIQGHIIALQEIFKNMEDEQ